MQIDESVQTIRCEGFLKLLMEFRTILLQDAVILKQMVPSHELFQNEIFQSSEFQSFAEELTRTIDSATSLAEVEIQCVMPQINLKISDVFGQVRFFSRLVGENCGVNSALVDTITANVLENMGNIWAIFPACLKMEQQEVEKEDSEEDEESAKRYKLSRDITNVLSLWKEWTTGLALDKPSVNQLNETYGIKWRQDPKGTANM
ncbi:MAG: hypothetical protein EXX96DRAFT_627263 [Benjaminiella poitrasii]|nr:MAG: hypothetical protein EXX96DRAFT_627263 [Benjaminiella poitrasii]